jgi:hypothetical protein
MPRESLDAPEDLPKQATRQVALGQLEDKDAAAAIAVIHSCSPPGRTQVHRHEALALRFQSLSSVTLEGCLQSVV